VEENITFGIKFDQSKFDQAIKLSCMEEDLNQFPNGKDSLIGERGINISGG
jgi:ABC-type multidrug transport system fused ATPase/permease subunit